MLSPPGGEGESGDLMGVNCTLGSRFKYFDISCEVVIACDLASSALVDAEDLYDIKSSESSDEVVAAEVAVEPALNTVACEDDEDEFALVLLRMALYSSVDRLEVDVMPALPREVLYAVASAYLLPFTTPLLSSLHLVCVLCCGS